MGETGISPFFHFNFPVFLLLSAFKWFCSLRSNLQAICTPGASMKTQMNTASGHHISNDKNAYFKLLYVHHVLWPIRPFRHFLTLSKKKKKKKKTKKRMQLKTGPFRTNFSFPVKIQQVALRPAEKQSQRDWKLPNRPAENTFYHDHFSPEPASDKLLV